jgi:D-3-phosphoglycerate dehydrogenase
MKVLIIDTVDPLLSNGLRQLGFEVEEDYTSPKEEITQKISKYSGLVIRSRFPVDAPFLRNATHLKFIGRVGAGMENIDTPFAESMGIHLIKAPEGNRDAVGEQAVGMLLMLFNNLKRADAEVRAGIWKREENRGLEINGKTVGIIGYGYMGSAFAEKLKGFGCTVLAYDKYKNGFGNEAVKEVSLEELQQQADIVSLHIPQAADTLGMFNADFIQSFRKPFYLVNTARGKSVNTEDLVAGLQAGKVLGACLDVLEYEKASFENMFNRVAPDGASTHKMELPDAFQYLIQSDKVILSPHIAGWSHESNKKMAQVILDKVQALNLLIDGN